MERYFEINRNGHNIRCKLYCREIRSIRQAVIFCHGFGGHKDNSAAAKFAERMISKHKYSALITFNWPCHGDDVKKKLTLADCDTYLSLVIDHVRENYAQEICCYATSFGGYLTLKYIHDHGSPFRRTVLRCPAVNLYDAMTHKIMTEENRQLLEKGREALVGFDRKVPVSPAFLEEIRSNDIRTLEYLDWAEDILILHGTKDEIISFEEAQAFSENTLIDFVAIEGADHRFRSETAMDQAIKAILDFFAL